MLSRTSFKADLRAYRENMKPPAKPGHPGPLGRGNRNTADMQLIERWLADDRVEEVWSTIQRDPPSQALLSSVELIRTVLAARRSAQASVNRVFGTTWKGKNLGGWSDELRIIKNKLASELSKPPSKIDPMDVAKILEDTAKDARVLYSLYHDFSDHLGLPGNNKFEMSRKDQSGTRVRKLFMQILGDFLTTRLGRPFDEPVAVLTEIAFPGKPLDRDEVIAARKPTTKARRSRRMH
jgi:hypothetical protein